MAAKDLLSHGIIWRIGDGHSIKIWGDKWLPNVGFLVVSPESFLHSDAMVSDLIDSSLPGRNCSLIDSIFSVNEARIIKSIPLCPSLPPDKIIWNGTSNGMFFVRSAYHLGLELMRRQEGECSTRPIRGDFWKRLWSIKAPNSLKFFLWRACHNLLPTKQNLLRKGVVEDGLCPCCKIQEESTIHALWSCPSAQDVGEVALLSFRNVFLCFQEWCSLSLSYLIN
jgi:hypothetical protein